MRSLLRAIAAAIRSWFRMDRGGRKRLAAAPDRRDLAATDVDHASGSAVARARGLLRIDADGTASLGRLDAPAMLPQGEKRPHAEEGGAAAGAEAREQAEEAACAAAEVEAGHEGEEDGRARRVGEAQARRQAEEAQRAAADAEAQHRVEENVRAIAAAAQARWQVDDAARAVVDAEAKRKAEKVERARVSAEAEARRQAEEATRAAAEAEATRKAEEKQAPVAAENEGGDRSDADTGPWPQAGNGRPPEASADAHPANGEELTEEATEPTAGRAPRTRAPRYRGPAGKSSAPRQPPSTVRTAAARAEPAAGGNHVLPIELRVLFERGGSLGVTLLPRRRPELPGELTVWAPAGTVELTALQEDWYQDVSPPNLGALLLEGVLWRDEATGQEWLLSGRDIFVLTSGTAHRGLVTCPRLVVGREHAVLCTTTRLAAVAGVLREAGCEGWRALDDEDGAPRGWVLLCDVLPRRPVPWTDNSDILNALRPPRQVEIALEGGICLGYSSWLAGHPPSIRVYGDPDDAGAVQIDGHSATATADGRYTAPGWDSAGRHEVRCNGATRSFSVVRRELPSKSWVAFSFPTPSARHGRIAICGPLVRAFTGARADGEDAPTSEIIQVYPANPVLLGSLPGQVVVTYPRPDVRGAQCIVSSQYTPVWAIPAQPLHCDKRDNRVRLVGHPLLPGEGSGEVTARISRSSIQQWCSAIRDAGRKGLAVEPADPAVAELWRRYRRYARDLWRRLR